MYYIFTLQIVVEIMLTVSEDALQSFKIVFNVGRHIVLHLSLRPCQVKETPGRSTMVMIVLE